MTITAEEKKYLEEPYTHRPIVSAEIVTRLHVGDRGPRLTVSDWPHLMGISATEETVEQCTARMHPRVTATWRERP